MKIIVAVLLCIFVATDGITELNSISTLEDKVITGSYPLLRFIKNIHTTVAAILYLNRLQCSAAIVTVKVVLTAVRCVEEFEHQPKFGDARIIIAEETHEIEIIKRTPHPELVYDKRYEYGPYYDISIIKMMTPTEKQPISLPDNQRLLFESECVTLIGRGRKGLDALMLVIVRDGYCDIAKYNANEYEKIYCAGLRDLNSNAKLELNDIGSLISLGDVLIGIVTRTPKGPGMGIIFSQLKRHYPAIQNIIYELHNSTTPSSSENQPIIL